MMRRNDNTASRSGVVLLSTMVVIVILALTAYHFSDLAVEEYRAADAAHRQVQARAAADSGVHYMAAKLTQFVYPSQQSSTAALTFNPYHDEQFRDVEVPSQGGRSYQCRFTLLAPPDPGNIVPASPPTSNDRRYGVTDETGKLNVNAFMMIDPTGSTLNNFLLNLQFPINGQTSISDGIMDFLDYDTTSRPGGGENNNPNGPLDSIELLGLARGQGTGVTPDILYGNDLNRNGQWDKGEPQTNGSNYMPGLWDQMTTHSRELLVSPTGTQMVWLNDTSLTNLNTNLQAIGMDPSVINYILLVRMKAATAISSAGGAMGTQGGSGTQTLPGDLTNPADLNLSASASNQISSIWQLVDTQVTFSKTTNTPTTIKLGNLTIKSTKTTTINTVYTSPFTQGNIDPTKLGKLFLYTTPWGGGSAAKNSGGGSGAGGGGGGGGGGGNNGSGGNASTSTGPQLSIPTYERPARVNINTCRPEVLQALLTAILQPNSSNGSSGSGGNSGTTNSGNSSTSPTTIAQSIMAARPALTQMLDPEFQTPVWLYTKASLTSQQLQQLDPYFTTVAQVFRVQVEGRVFRGDGTGKDTTARIEAVIDTNGGNPRILAWRDLTELGRGTDATKK